MRPSDDAITARLFNTIQGWSPEEYAKDYSMDQRRQLAKEGKCRADLKFPIVDTEDLKNAIGLARSPTDRAWCKKRAAALGASKMIPEEWAFFSGETLTESAAAVAPHDAAVTKAIKDVVALQEKAPDGKTDPNDAKVLAALHEARDAQQKDNQGHGLAY